MAREPLGLEGSVRGVDEVVLIFKRVVGTCARPSKDVEALSGDSGDPSKDLEVRAFIFVLRIICVSCAGLRESLVFRLRLSFVVSTFVHMWVPVLISQPTRTKIAQTGANALHMHQRKAPTKLDNASA